MVLDQEAAHGQNLENTGIHMKQGSSEWWGVYEQALTAAGAS
jgi:hypothetical protein